MNMKTIALFCLLCVPLMGTLDKFTFEEERAYADSTEFEEPYQREKNTLEEDIIDLDKELEIYEVENYSEIAEILGDVNLWREILNNMIIKNQDGKAHCRGYILSYYMKKHMPSSAYQRLANIFISLTENLGISNSIFTETSLILFKIRAAIHSIQLCLIRKKFIPEDWNIDLTKLISSLEKLGLKYKYMDFKSIARKEGKKFFHLIKDKIKNKIENVFKGLGITEEIRSHISTRFTSKFGEKLIQKLQEMEIKV